MGEVSEKLGISANVAYGFQRIAARAFGQLITFLFAWLAESTVYAIRISLSTQVHVTTLLWFSGVDFLEGRPKKVLLLLTSAPVDAIHLEATTDTLFFFSTPLSILNFFQFQLSLQKSCWLT